MHILWTTPLVLLFASMPLPFSLGANGDILVPVTIEGAGPFPFLLDTGSSRSAITERLARRLGLSVDPAAPHTQMVTPWGRVRRPLAAISRLAIGTAPPAAVTAMVLPDARVRGGPAVDGLIGQDVLARLTYTIDYGRRQILWHAAGAEPVGLRLPLDLGHGRAIVSLPQAGGTPVTLRLVADSGANGLVLFARKDGPLPPVTPLDTALIGTLAGRRVVRSVLVDELLVGDVRLRGHRGVVMDAAGPRELIGDGLLPLHLFSRVTFGGPGGYLIVER